MFWISVLLVCAALVCAHALLWVRKRHALKLLSGLPTFPALPFIGNTHLLPKNSQHFLEILSNMSRISEEKMLPFVFWICQIPLIVLTDPGDIKTLSNAALNKPYFYTFSKNFFGNGLISAPASIWKHTSKKLSGAFSSRVVAGYQDVFNALAQELVRELRGKAGGAPFDVSNYVSNVSLKAICRIVLGKSRTPENVINPEYHQVMEHLRELMIKRGLNPLLYPDFTYHLTPAHQETYKCESVLDDVSNKVLRFRQREREEMKQNGTFQRGESTGNKFRPYVDILLDLAETDSTYTAKQISDEMNTIIGAGSDTVTCEICMALIVIGKNPVVQDKLYSEIKSIFGESKRPIDREDLTSMPYCEAVINETLRLYPAVPVVLRNAEQDVKLDSCTIPAGSICALCMWGTGRSRRVWGDDAEQFRPERWLQLDPVETARLQAAFAIGKRSCMGKKYAMAFMKTFLAHCIRELVFVGEDKELRLHAEITLKASEGHLLQVHLR